MWTPQPLPRALGFPPVRAGTGACGTPPSPAPKLPGRGRAGLRGPAGDNGLPASKANGLLLSFFSRPARARGCEGPAALRPRMPAPLHFAAHCRRPDWLGRGGRGGMGLGAVAGLFWRSREVVIPAEAVGRDWAPGLLCGHYGNSCVRHWAATWMTSFSPPTNQLCPGVVKELQRDSVTEPGLEAPPCQEN